MVTSFQTQVLSVSPTSPDESAIRVAGDILQKGGLVAFPTETVYGLGANALDPEAVAQIYQVKGRPAHNPLIVHVATLAQLDTVAYSSELVKRLAAEFWPGPLTLVLPKRPQIPSIVCAGQSTIGVRIPAHPVAIALLQSSGLAIAAPSANRSNYPSPTSAAHVMDDLAGTIEIILDGGHTAIGLESTIINLTTAPPTLLRPGGVSYEQLKNRIPDLQILTSQPHHLIFPSPGLGTKHYSPQAELLVFHGSRSVSLNEMLTIATQRIESGQSIGFLSTDEDDAILKQWVSHYPNSRIILYSLGSVEQLDQIAHRLFAGLRQLDNQGVSVIFCRSLPTTGIGLAIADRLQRAAGQITPIHP